MNPYSVELAPDAQDQLASLWLLAPDRDAVTNAANTIDRLLAGSPTTAGREVAEGLWTIQVSPLIAFYEIDEPARRVEITRVRRCYDRFAPRTNGPPSGDRAI